MIGTWKKRWKWIGIQAVSMSWVGLGWGLVLADKHGYRYQHVWKADPND